MRLIIGNESKKNIFKNIFKHLKVFGTEFNLMFSQEQLYIQGMDDAHISLFELKLVKSWFDEYNVDVPVTIGINIETLFKILNMRKDDQNIQLSFEAGGDELDIQLIGKIKQQFGMPLMDLNVELLQVPKETEWSADLEIQSKLLADIMTKQSFFGDVVKIKCTETEVVMTSNDATVGKMETYIKFDDLIEYCVEEKGCIEVSYSLQYVLYMTCFAEIANIVTMNISTNIPMRLHYPFHNENDENGDKTNPENYMSFYLAPKIEDEY